MPVSRVKLPYYSCISNIDIYEFKDYYNDMILREMVIHEIMESFRIHPVTALLGPRQVGKTTLARMFSERFKGESVFFDLESPVDMRRLEAPELAFTTVTAGLIVIDEIQRRPALFELLRVLVDRPGFNKKFLVLGSASPTLLKGVTESLAGRIGFVDVSGLNLAEVGIEHWMSLWVRGGFPRAFLAETDMLSQRWRDDFIRTFLERDIPLLGIRVPMEALRRFWLMVAHFHGNVWNGAEFARSLGVSEPTVRRYLDILAGAYMIRILPPWFENVGKRQVKSPKVYMRDSGLLHTLLGIGNAQRLHEDPKVGLSWEGFALEQIVSRVHSRDIYFWGTQSGAELDLLVMVDGKRYGFEMKLSDSPGTTKSMHTAIETLRLECLFVVYPGQEAYALAPQIKVLPLTQIPSIEFLK